MLILNPTHWNFTSSLWQILMLPTDTQSFTTALRFGFLRTVFWNSCRLNSWHREFNILVILFSVLLQGKPVLISPDLKKLTNFSYHLNREEKKVVMHISDIKKNKILLHTAIQIPSSYAFLASNWEGGMYFEQERCNTQHKSKIVIIKHQQGGEKEPATTAGN